MSAFDLLFLILFLTAVCTMTAAVWFALRRQFGRARCILFRLLAGAATYMAVVIAVSLILPRRTVNIGDSRCFDDWCISLAGFRRAPKGTQTMYSVDLRLSSRARRVSQRENNVAVYLTDEHSRRYNPVARNSYVPFNVLLRPQDTILVSRAFLVPTEAAEVSAVITHQGGFPIGWFIAGYDTWFRKPPRTRLH
ncbi:MAG: hypothetical protein ACRD9L_06670 [Bryobacteraceae bacterium]